MATGLVLKASYENKDRGVKEPLKATLRFRGDKGLAHFEVKGATSRFTQIDQRSRRQGPHRDRARGKEDFGAA